VHGRGHYPHLDVLPTGEEVEVVPRGLAVANEDELGVRRARRNIERERSSEEGGKHDWRWWRSETSDSAAMLMTRWRDLMTRGGRQRKRLSFFAKDDLF